MALKNCKECNHQISTGAKTCPGCGAVNPKGMSLLLKVSLIFFGLCFFMLILTSRESGQADSVTTKLETSLPSAIQKPILDKKEIKSILNPFRKKIDKMEGVTWITNPGDDEVIDSKVMVYMGEKDGYYWLRFKVRYHGDNWLFLENLKFLVDEVVYEYPLKNQKVERDNRSTVWEWIDVKAEEKEISILKAIAKGKKAEIRYIGSKYHRDRKITSSEKKAISRMVNAYRKLK